MRLSLQMVRSAIVYGRPVAAMFTGGRQVWEQWTPARLFADGQAGHVADYKPEAFATALLFGTATAGHAADYVPQAFEPALMFGPATPGHAANYEV